MIHIQQVKNNPCFFFCVSSLLKQRHQDPDRFHNEETMKSTFKTKTLYTSPPGGRLLRPRAYCRKNDHKEKNDLRQPELASCL